MTLKEEIRKLLEEGVADNSQHQNLSEATTGHSKRWIPKFKKLVSKYNMSDETGRGLSFLESIEWLEDEKNIPDEILTNLLENVYKLVEGAYKDGAKS